MMELFAHRAQVQERLTKQVTDWLDAHLQPRGVGVVIGAVGSRTVTATLLGTLRSDARSHAEFLAAAGVGA